MSPTPPDYVPLDLRPLPGSERPPAPGLHAPGTALAPGEQVEVTLVLRRRGEAPDPGRAPAAPAAPVAATDFAERFGADPADVELVTSTLTGLGAQVLQVDPASRRIRIAGSAELLSRIFGTSLEQVTSTGPDGRRPIAIAREASACRRRWTAW
jgi:kumamolisin